MEQQRGIVILKRYVVAAKGCHMGADRQPQEVKHRAAVLSMGGDGKQSLEDDEEAFFHVKKLKTVQS
jgi:hypothetical protein